jgi:hypothetical protein
LVLMTATEPRSAVPVQAIPATLPLQPEDPPRVGEFWLQARLGANAAGYLYAASDDSGREVVVAMMTEGSADDAAARDRFVWSVDQLPAAAVLGHNGDDDDDLALWVAVGPIRPDDGSSSAADERQLAEVRGQDVLSMVLMDRVPHVGRFRGPDFRHYWENRRRPGLFRIWPLPWPAVLRPASRVALILSLLTMLLLMLVAMLIAWLLFRNQPEIDPGPVIPEPSGTQTVTVTPTTPPPGTNSPPTPTPSTPSGVPTTVPTPGGTGTGPFPTTPGGTDTPPSDPGDRF